MVLNSVYMTISSLNLGFSTADLLCAVCHAAKIGADLPLALAWI